MKTHAALIAALALSIAACSGGEQPPAAEKPATKPPDVDAAFIAHMHSHAEMLDEINNALAEGNLYAAITPAYWLAAHDETDRFPPQWHKHLVGMRESAADVEVAPDLEAARTAAKRIMEHCQGCHELAGVEQLDLDKPETHRATATD